MKKILIASPHPDDAFFSLGASILDAKKHKLLIWDIFNVQEYTLLNEDKESARIRIIEEERTATRITNSELRLEDLPEAGLRGYRRLGQMLKCKWSKKDLSVEEKSIYNKVCKAFIKVLLEWKPDWVGIPLGCGGHIDHIIVREAVLNKMKCIDPEFVPRIFLYEELPYALNRQWVLEALEECAALGRSMKEYLLPIDGLDLEKEELISVYRSQIKKRDASSIISYAGSFERNGKWERIWRLRDSLGGT